MKTNKVIEDRKLLKKYAIQEPDLISVFIENIMLKNSLAKVSNETIEEIKYEVDSFIDTLVTNNQMTKQFGEELRNYFYNNIIVW